MKSTVDLSVDFVGLSFPNPFLLPSAQSVRTGEMIHRAFEAGWGGAVTQTITVDEIEIENARPRLHSYKVDDAVVGVMNIELTSPRSVADWIADIGAIKREFPDRPLLASITGRSDRRADWVELTDVLGEAGADGFELNVSVPHGLTERGSGAAVGQDPGRIERVTSWVSSSTDKPILVKLPPDVTDVVELARAALRGGANGVTATNNLRAVGGVDIETMTPLPAVGGLSTLGGYGGPGLKPVAQRCVAEIGKELSAPIVGTGGIKTWQDAVEYFLLGASVVQVYTGVLQHGYRLIDELCDGLAGYLSEQSVVGVSELVGKALPKLVSHRELDRGIGTHAVYDPELCIQCGQCYLACEESGFQAISLRSEGFPLIDLEACDGCGLCVALCPIEGCMWSELAE